MGIAVGMHQNQGKREYQQDVMSIKNFGPIGVLAILADGMGGYEGGEIASKLVSENFREFTIEDENIGESLKKYLLKGNEAIKSYKQEHSEVKSMGTTAIAFFMTEKSCQWVSVGDSPLYVIRNRSKISRINENHSVAGLLDLQVKNGEISREEALSSGQRHMLTSAISGENISQMNLSVSWTTRSDDIFILASDGIETISEDRIREIVLGHVPVATQENMQNACEALVQEVMHIGTKNQDNVTVIMLAKMEDSEPKTMFHRSTKISKMSMLLAVGMVMAAVALAIMYSTLSGEKNKTTEHIKGSVHTTVKKQNIQKQAVAPNKSINQGNITKSEDNSSKPKFKKDSNPKSEVSSKAKTEEMGESDAEPEK